MAACDRHPDRETPFRCMKHGVALCEECLACRDPELYCKHRSACPIWFIEKRRKRLKQEEEESAARPRIRVRFEPGARMSEVPRGATLLDAARAGGLYLNASCNGKGLCGKCKLIVESGAVEAAPNPLLSDAEKARGMVLACQARVLGEVRVRIPEESLHRRLQVVGMGEEATARLAGRVMRIEPLAREVAVELSPPTLEDAVSDLDRLQRGLKRAGCEVERLTVGLSVLRDLANIMRQSRWQVSVTVLRRRFFPEVLEVRPAEPREPSLGLAVDLGTTTIVVYLVDMADGRILAASSGHNRQAACGDDVINRIVCAEKDGVRKLSEMALATVNGLIGETLEAAGARAHQVKNAVIAGNTIMTHLLLAIEPRWIRRAPYIPVASEYPVLKAAEIGLTAHPGAAVFLMPGPASYVGGDIVAGILFSGLHREDPLTLFIDVGTNGEIVLGNREWMMTAACSAGPAFEGGGIRWGMRAEAGAIEAVRIHPQTWEPEIRTVGGEPPRGICGSGMIELMAEMLAAGIVDRSGAFAADRPHPRLRRLRDEWVYVLVPAAESPLEEDLTFSASDLRNLLYSKAAVYAGLRTLLREAGLEASAVERFWIAGGFGQFLDVDKAIRIGLLPDLDRGRFQYLGNSSIAGAYLALLSEDSRREARDISRAMTYLDLSSHAGYMEEFTSALFLPHTHLETFPSAARPRP
ncbi:MAG: ASKHA domain-containing protein [Desulfobacterales bacterium]